MQPRIEKTYRQRWLITKYGQKVSVADILQHYIDNNDVLVGETTGAEIEFDVDVSVPLVSQARKKRTKKKST